MVETGWLADIMPTPAAEHGVMGVTDSVAIAVLGGGPGGCAAARGLAALGHQVALVTTPRRQGAVEGLSPRAVEGLRATGCDAALGRLGTRVERTAHWNGETRAVNHEFLIERGAFDAALREDAARAQVRLVPGRVDRVVADAGEWHVLGREETGRTFDWRARFLIEARGRAARPARRRRDGPATLALLRRYRVPGGSTRGTRLASFRDGWIWLAMPGDGSAFLQAMIGSGRGRLPSRPGLDDHLASLLEQCPEIRDALAGARPAGPTQARWATPVLNVPASAAGLIRVGDAAMAMDPLSGHGIFEALSAALVATAVVNTVLCRPADAAIAGDFYRARLEELFLRRCRTGRELYAAEQRWPDRPFWAERRAWPEASPAQRPPAAMPATIAEHPVIENGFVARRRVVVTADRPRGVWQVEGVPVADLLDFVRAQDRAGAGVVAEAAASRFNCGRAHVSTALAWLRAHGLAAGA